MNQADDTKLEAEDTNSEGSCAIDCIMDMTVGAIIFFIGIGISILSVISYCYWLPIIFTPILGVSAGSITSYAGLKVIGRNFVK